MLVNVVIKGRAALIPAAVGSSARKRTLQLDLDRVTGTFLLSFSSVRSLT